MKRVRTYKLYFWFKGETNPVVKKVIWPVGEFPQLVIALDHYFIYSSSCSGCQLTKTTQMESFEEVHYKEVREARQLGDIDWRS